MNFLYYVTIVAVTSFIRLFFLTEIQNDVKGKATVISKERCWNAGYIQTNWIAVSVDLFCAKA